MAKIIITVVIPYKDRLNYVREAIQSIYSQDFDRSKIEIIAVDDKGGDKKTRNSLKKKFEGVRFVDNLDKEGPGGKRNTGIKLAKGKYIIFLDSDDQLKSTFVNEACNILEQSKKVGATICFSERLFENNFPLKEKVVRLFLASIWDLGIYTGYLLNNKNMYKASFYLSQVSHMCFKSEVIKKMRFNYDYRRGGEDWDFVFRVLQKSKIQIIPKKLLVFRYSLVSSTYTRENIIKKWASYDLLVSRIPKQIKKSFYFKLFQLYIGLFRN